MKTSILDVSDLGLVSGWQVRLKPISFSLKSGQLVQLVGENGSGKSTLLKLLAGLLNPTQGGISYQQDPISTSNSSWKEMVTYIGQKDLIPDQYTPIHYHALVCTLFGGKFPDNDYFGLDGFASRSGEQLSVGQQRRAVFTRLLYSKSKIWLLDEPFAGLDKDGCSKLTDKIYQHLNKKDTLVIMANHQPHEFHYGKQKTIELKAS